MYGIKTCVDPGGNASVDIVFIHGLTGGRESTWTDRTAGIFWPEKLLPQDLPNARILTYGYDADIVHFWAPASQSRIGNHAQTLLQALGNLRERTETDGRPLIFVVHSLGGLVVEDMLLSSRNSAEEHLAKIVECTRAIAFLGTPHCGSDLGNWATVISGLANVLKKSSNTALVGVLRPESEVLARIQQDFHTMLRARGDAGKPPVKITCFFEDLPVKGAGEVVPKHSAILPAYSSVAIHANHMDMPKFSSAEDAGYQAVSSELWRWERDIRRMKQMVPSTTQAPMSAWTNAQMPATASVGSPPSGFHQTDASSSSLPYSPEAPRGNIWHGQGATASFRQPGNLMFPQQRSPFMIENGDRIHQAGHNIQGQNVQASKVVQGNNLRNDNGDMMLNF